MIYLIILICVVVLVGVVVLVLSKKQPRHSTPSHTTGQAGSPLRSEGICGVMSELEKEKMERKEKIFEIE